MTELTTMLVEVRASWKRLVDLHQPEVRRATHGRRPQVGPYCTVCKVPAPCKTRAIAEAELEKLAA